MKRYILTILLCGLYSYAIACEKLSLKIAHVNDTHSHFKEEVIEFYLPDIHENPVLTFAYTGGYPRLKTKIDQLRNEAKVEENGFLLLHAGDVFTGTIYFSLFKGKISAELMNHFGFDAMVIGNHEFDLGNEVLSDFIKSVDFPILSANLKIRGPDPLKKLYLPLTVKKFNGTPVAIVGLTTEYTKIISSPSTRTGFLNARKIANKIVNKLTDININNIIILSHLGLEADRELAKAVPGIDVIIGGHSHETLGDFTDIGAENSTPNPIKEKNRDGDIVCILQAGEHAQTIGVTDVVFSELGSISSCNAQNIFLVGNMFAQETPPQPVDPDTYQTIYSYIAASKNIEIVDKDTLTISMLDEIEQEVSAFEKTIIGVAGSPLYHVRLPGDHHPRGGVISYGSMVAPHVAQSMALKMEQISGNQYVAMVNAGGVRGDLEDEIIMGSVYSILPFSSTLVSMTVTGESLINTLNRNVTNAYRISSVSFPYVANIRYSLNLSDMTNPQIEHIQIKNRDGIYHPIDLLARYHLVTTSFLAGGGDLYSFTGAENITDTGHIDVDAFIEYVEEQKDVLLNESDSGVQ
jgi:5'-nucleotidase